MRKQDARQSDRRRHRQPNGENHRKRRSAGKEINGCKRHIITDTQGNLVGMDVHAADIQDPLADSEASSICESRDRGSLALASIRRLDPWMRHVFADGDYAGAKLRAALLKMGRWNLELIKRSDRAKASWLYRADGSSSAHLHGSVVAAGSQRILNAPSKAPPHGCLSLTSEPSPDDSQKLEINGIVLSQALKKCKRCYQATSCSAA